MSVFASQSPRFYDDLLLVDSTPVECARSRETVKRFALGDAADYSYCASHSRFFWGFRLHPLAAPDGAPRAVTVASPKRDERDVALELLACTRRQGPVTLIGDKGYAGREFAARVSDMNATILRPRRKDEPGKGPHLAPIRQRIESIIWSCKGTLTLEHHGRQNRRRALRAHPATPPHPRRRHLPEPPTRSTQPAHSSSTALNPVESLI
jgi:hypothetical protein